MKKAVIFTWVMILFLSFPLFSQVLSFGPNSSQIGRDQGNGEDWMPLFFAQEPNGTIHIPDFYKGRIVLFDSKGQFLKAITTEVGLIPSLNYFSRSPQGNYILFSNFTLWILDPAGKLKGKFAFPMGFFPEGFFVSETGVSLKTGDRGYFFTWEKVAQGPQVGSITMGSVSLATTGFGESAAFNLGGQLVLKGWKSSELESFKSAFLVRQNPDGHTFWGQKSGIGWKTFEISDQGKILKTIVHNFNFGDKLSFTLLCDDQSKWSGGVITDTSFVVEGWK